MPRTSNLSPENLLRFLQVKSEPASTNDIVRGLHLGKTDRRPLFKILTKLKKRNAIEELPGGRYRLAKRGGGETEGGRKEQLGDRNRSWADKAANNLRQGQGTGGNANRQGAVSRNSGPDSALTRDEIKGRLVLHHDGYGFVVPSTPMPQLDGDIFVPRVAIEGAMHGDQVVVKIKPTGGVTGARRVEGRIVRILGRAHLSVVGLFRYGSRGNVVRPYDTRIQHEVEIPLGDELTPALCEKLGLGGANEPGVRG